MDLSFHVDRIYRAKFVMFVTLNLLEQDLKKGRQKS